MTADTATGRYGDAAIARRVVAWGPGVLSSADQGLARGRIELDHVIVRGLARSDEFAGRYGSESRHTCRYRFVRPGTREGRSRVPA